MEEIGSKNLTTEIRKMEGGASSVGYIITVSGSVLV
jgi:hypothetical protein